MWCGFQIDIVGDRPIVRVPISLSTSPPTTAGIVYVVADIDFQLPHCVFRSELATQLGIPDWRSSAQTAQVLLRESGQRQVYLHPLSFFFRYGDLDLEGPDCLMGFTDSMPPYVEGILGRNGCFGRYSVRYDLINRVVSVDIAEPPAKPLVYGAP